MEVAPPFRGDLHLLSRTASTGRRLERRVAGWKRGDRRPRTAVAVQLATLTRAVLISYHAGSVPLALASGSSSTAHFLVT